MDGAPLPPLPALDEAGRACLRRLLTARSATEVEAAADARALPLDVRMLACGARLALDEWRDEGWTPALLARIASHPSPAWQSIVLAIDAGLPGSAWVLAHALADPDRPALAALGVPALTAIAAAGGGDEAALPDDVDRDLADLIRSVAVVRRELGRVPRPWEDDYGEQAPVTDLVRSMVRTLPARLRAAGLTLPDEPEIDDVLRGTVDDDGADWIIYTLDAIAAEIATRLEPSLSGALPPPVRARWTAAWTAYAHAALAATGTTSS